MTTTEKKPQGLATLPTEERKRIAQMGRRAAQQGRGHKFTRDEMQRGGKKGGSISRRKSKKPTSGA